MLPEEKITAPALVMLDSTHWMRLSAAHHGESNDPSHAQALEALRRAIDDGRAITAIDFINTIEAMQHEDRAKRERLARFMVAIASNRFTTIVDLRGAQVRAAIATELGLRAVPPRLRSSLLSVGLARVFPSTTELLASLTPAMRALQERLSLLPEVSVRAITDQLGAPQNIDEGRSADTRAAEAIQASREVTASLSVAERRRGELHNAWSTSFAEVLDDQLADLAVDSIGFRTWLADNENIEKLSAQVPHMHVAIELLLHSSRHTRRAFEANDTRDLSFYRLAIPYANVVGAERYWGECARAARLDKHYGTTIAVTPSELARALDALT